MTGRVKLSRKRNLDTEIHAKKRQSKSTPRVKKKINLEKRSFPK